MLRSTLPLYAARRKPSTPAGVVCPQIAETLHERYLGDVYRYVARRVARREEAEDITSEVFAAAITAWPRYRGAASPHLYLLGIARRKIVDARRRRRTRDTLAADEGDALDTLAETVPAVEAGPEARLISSERRREIRGLVETLKEEQREALLLHYVEGLPVAEAAQVMGKSPGAFNSLLQRARATLLHRGRAYFLNEDDDEANTGAEGKR